VVKAATMIDATGTPAAAAPDVATIWRWLAEVPDPEIPVLSVVDLGIVRDVAWSATPGARECVVTITPTYSGCPATAVIADSIAGALRERGVANVRLETRLAPAWTTDWMSEQGRRKLAGYGIAPPAHQAIPVSAIGRADRREAAIACPRCGSTRTQAISEFGSTPCKALHRCLECLEPFDYFKPH
jgi:ring-1,2-phenylacetyl-CoA epoxidase subunit PaaD